MNVQYNYFENIADIFVYLQTFNKVLHFGVLNFIFIH